MTVIHNLVDIICERNFQINLSQTYMSLSQTYMSVKAPVKLYKKRKEKNHTL